VCAEIPVGLYQSEVFVCFHISCGLWKGVAGFLKRWYNYISIEEAKDAVESAAAQSYVIRRVWFPVPFCGDCACVNILMHGIEIKA